MLFGDLWFVQMPPPMGECMGGWVVYWINGGLIGGHQMGKITKNWINFYPDNLILFEDLWFVETLTPMDGCIGGWLDGWVDG